MGEKEGEDGAGRRCSQDGNIPVASGCSQGPHM